MSMLVTNNPLVEEQFQSEFKVEFIETDLLGILTYIRGMVHKGYKLLTHPLSGSIKPNESPYKSVLITGNREDNAALFEADFKSKTDFQSVDIIEKSIQTACKFPPKHIPEHYLSDLQMIDLELIRSAMVSLKGQM